MSHLCRGSGEKFPEILFQSEFTLEHPEKDQWKDIYRYQVPIKRLVHITHDAEASKICEEFEFKAGPKFGKVLGVYNGRPCGESFKLMPQEVECTKIAPEDLVFPGFYSWWSIEPQPVQISVALERERCFVPDYLKEVPESRYGNHAFSCKFLISYLPMLSHEVVARAGFAS